LGSGDTIQMDIGELGSDISGYPGLVGIGIPFSNGVRFAGKFSLDIGRGVPIPKRFNLKTAVGIRHLWKNTMYHKNLQGFSRCAEQLFAATSLTAKISDVERT
jgi:hypothetical protein